jgi:ATP-binding cassette subfamily F protein uup
VAAPVVSCEAVTVVAGTTTLLDELSLGVSVGDRIGVVGRNGAGKSTLVRVLAGELAVDAGRVVTPNGTRVGVLSQRDDLDPDATVLTAAIGAATLEHEWRGDPHVRAVLSGLGVEPLLARSVGTLSGGERRRVALAALLVSDLELLILDEPTNHLDVEGVAWLAAHLTGRPRHRALVAVTHDRWFLDEVATQTWEVASGAVHSYEGGYAAYVLARAERSRQRDASDARRANLVRKELAWLRRGAPARTSKPRYRVEAANALIAAEPPPRDREGLQRFAAARLGKQVYDLEHATLALAGRRLLDDVTWRLGPGDRVGLVGVNGAGKTTLLRVLVGEQRLDDGTLRTGQTVQLAYLSQDVAELDGALRVLEAVEEVARVLTLGKEELSAGQLLERFGFPADRQWTPVRDLSGGERRRLQLLRLLMDGPNVLVLDEPTNDLDTDTLVALEDLLDAFAGTVVVVSHDRWFLERVCDTTAALMGDGSLAALPGGVQEYLRRRVAAPAAGPASSTRIGDTRSDAKTARREMATVEKALERLDRQVAKLHEAMAAAASDHARVLALDGELRALVEERTAAEERWLLLAEAADA